MICHYKTRQNNYLCNPIVKANNNKMSEVIQTVNCEDCLIAVENYKDEIIITSTQIQTNLLMLEV